MKGFVHLGNCGTRITVFVLQRVLHSLTHRDSMHAQSWDNAVDAFNPVSPVSSKMIPGPVQNSTHEAGGNSNFVISWKTIINMWCSLKKKIHVGMSWFSFWSQPHMEKTVSVSAINVLLFFLLCNLLYLLRTSSNIRKETTSQTLVVIKDDWVTAFGRDSSVRWNRNNWPINCMLSLLCPYLTPMTSESDVRLSNSANIITTWTLTGKTQIWSNDLEAAVRINMEIHAKCWRMGMFPSLIAILLLMVVVVVVVPLRRNLKKQTEKVSLLSQLYI